MTVNKKIQKVKWKLLVSFKTELLTEYLIQKNHYRMANVAGLPFKKRLIIDNDVYNDSAELFNVFLKIDKNLYSVANKIFNQVKRRSSRLLQYSRFISRNDFTVLVDRQLLKVFVHWLKLYEEVVFLIGAPGRLDEFLEDKIKEELRQYNIENVKDIFGVLSYPNCLSGAVKEKADLMELAVKNKLDNADINRHYIKYSWINLTLLAGELYTVNDIRNKIKQLSGNKEIEKELNNIRNGIGENQKLFLSLKKHYRFSKKFLKLVRLFQSATCFRTARLDWLNQACALMRPMLLEVAKRLGLTSEELIYCLPEEILNSLKRKKMTVAKKEIHRRMNKYLMVTLEGKYPQLILGHEIDKIKKSLMHEFAEKEIRGTIAYPGIVRGIVKIVKDRTELSKVKENDVLVSKLTTPDFVPAMEMASAIVTDLGGITSHAAIVARELKKPCIIGTRNATQILKDGDLVEVDTNNGVVKILKKK